MASIPIPIWPPLAEKLQVLSQAAATGGLVVTGALFAVPGGVAGIIVSNLSTANKLNDLGLEEVARKYTASQILDINRDLLKKMDVDDELSNKLLSNTNYTPIDMAAMVAALDSMSAVRDRDVFVARAAAADGRAIAYVMRRTAELMADDYRKHGGYVRFVSLAAFPYVITRDGRVTALLPIDALSWTRDTAVGFTQVSNERKRVGAQCARRIAHHRHGHRHGQGAAEGARLDRAGAPEAVKAGRVAGEKRALL